jgi:hypothetical protein
MDPRPYQGPRDCWGSGDSGYLFLFSIMCRGYRRQRLHLLPVADEPPATAQAAERGLGGMQRNLGHVRWQDGDVGLPPSTLAMTALGYHQLPFSLGSSLADQDLPTLRLPRRTPPRYSSGRGWGGQHRAVGRQHATHRLSINSFTQ